MIFFFAGLALGGVSASERGRPLRGWIGSDGEAREGHVVGRVLRAPELGEDGAWHLRAALRPEPDPAPGAPEAFVRLTIPSGADGEPSPVLSNLRAGDRIRVWARIGRPKRPGNPGQIDPRRILAARGEHASGWVKSPRLVELSGVGAAGPRRALDVALVWMRGRLDRALGPSGDARALAGAMLLGDREGLRPEVEQILRESGLAHLMAVSGLHVGIVVALLLVPMHPLLRRPLLSAAVLAPAILGFATVTGGAAPVSRAALMVLLALVARVAGRSADVRNSLAVTAAVLVSFHPPWIGHVGFQLSVCAVAGITTLAPLLAGRPWAHPAVRGALAISASAHAATAPVLAREFHRLSPSGLWANPPAVALAAVLVGGALAAALLADLPGVGGACAAATILTSRLLLSLASAAAETPVGSLRVPAPGGVVWMVHLGSWCALAFLTRRRTTSRRLATAAFLLALTFLHLGPPPCRDLDAYTSVLDVGQGQSVVLWGSASTCVVLDAAASAGGRYDLGDRLVVPLLLDGGCRRVEVLALSHGHDDHAGGAVSVLRGLDVGELWIPLGSVRDDGIRAALEAARSRRVAIRVVGRGGTSCAAGWRLDAVHPSRSDRRFSPNDRGLAIVATSAGGSSLLVAGDLEQEGERSALAAGTVPKAQALIAGHHGARESNAAVWLTTIAPRVVVISVGAGNRFGHPHAEALARLAAVGARVFRTDRDGQVRMYPSEGTWRVEVTVRPDGAGPG